MKVVVNPEAESEVESIWSQYADDRPSAAFAFARRYEQLLKMMGDFPKATPVAFRSTRGHDVRIRPIPQFPKLLAFYTVHATHVELLRIIHGARDWMAAFEHRPSQHEGEDA